jgi:hypothetical protein
VRSGDQRSVGALGVCEEALDLDSQLGRSGPALPGESRDRGQGPQALDGLLPVPGGAVQFRHVLDHDRVPKTLHGTPEGGLGPLAQKCGGEQRLRRRAETVFGVSPLHLFERDQEDEAQ